MTALVVRGLAERRLRSALTALAIMLGVAMIAGTYVQTDQIRQAFTDIEATAFGTTDVVITPKSAFDTDLSGVPTFDADVIERVEAVDGVALARGTVFQSGALVRDGKRVGSDFAPGIVNSDEGVPFSPAKYVEGEAPRSGEVAVNSKLAEDERLRLGERLAVATRTGVEHARLSGVFDYGNVASIGGATVIIAPLADVQRWYDLEGKVTSVLVAANPGVSAEALAERIRTAVPELRVRTGEAEATAQADRINEGIGGFLTPMLLSLAGAAVLVGTFIIFNTFSITVAQRTKEFALLRALGAAPRQIVAGVVGEALVIGTVATVAGIGAGFGFATALSALFDAIGFGIPRAAMTLEPRTIIVCALVGLGASIVAALAPAVRATRVPPIQAMTGTASPADRRRKPVATFVFLLLGLGLMLAGLFGGGPATSRLSGTAGGAVLLFVGLALASRWIVRPVASTIGVPIERFGGIAGMLARQNAMRNPNRTASTAAALMVGLGLVVFVAVFAAGVKDSVEGKIDTLITADVVVDSASTTEPLPAGAAAAATGADGVATVLSVPFDRVEVDGEAVKTTTDTIEGVDPKALRSVYAMDVVHGPTDAAASMRSGDALIESAFADAHGLRVGDRFTVTLPAGGHKTLTAIAEYDDPQLLQGMLVTDVDFRQLSANLDPYLLLVGADAGVDAERLRANVIAELTDFPGTDTYTRDGFRDHVVGRLDQVVNLLYALLAMSVVISLFGLANSLILSIHERTREFGLLRAVGATDRQVRHVVRYESVITSIIGGLLGIGVGLLFGWLVTTALGDLGLGFSVPPGQLVIFLFVAVIVGVVGAIGPARRGARIDVLEALRNE